MIAKRNSAAVATFAAIALAIASAEIYAVPSQLNGGELSFGSFSGEVIVLGQANTSISVYRGETVKFIDEQTGHSFTWRFDTPDDIVDLNQIAPAGALGGKHVTAHVLE